MHASNAFQAHMRRQLIGFKFACVTSQEPKWRPLFTYYQDDSDPRLVSCCICRVQAAGFRHIHAQLVTALKHEMLFI